MKTTTKKKVIEAITQAAGKTWKFVKENKFLFIQLGILVLPAAIGYCNDAAGYANQIEISPLKKPLAKLAGALTGPIPGAITGISVALGGCSWAMGWEQQVTQRCVKGAGGGAVAMGAGKFMSDLGLSDSATVSACLF